MNEGDRIKLKYIKFLERNILSFLNYQNSKIINKFSLDWEKFKVEIDRIFKINARQGEAILKDVYTRLYNDYGAWQYRQITGNLEGFMPSTLEIIREINRQAKTSLSYINGSYSKLFKRLSKYAVENDLTINEAKNYIIELIPAIDKKKALRIARTEVICESNKVSLKSAMQVSGKVKKYWIYTHDSRTRKTHKKAGVEYSKNKAIPLDKNFKVGKAELKHPADRDSLHKEEVFNCRCTLGYVKKED